MSTPLYDDLLRAMDSIRRPLYDAFIVPPGLMQEKRLSTAEEIMARNHLFGMRVIETPFARVPRRVHKKRRWMSAQYHRRIQKKWDKRFGYKPAAFLVNTDALFRWPMSGARGGGQNG